MFLLHLASSTSFQLAKLFFVEYARHSLAAARHKGKQRKFQYAVENYFEHDAQLKDIGINMNRERGKRRVSEFVQECYLISAG
jgi:hypothetical protein